jgi:hypothetical protein
MSEATFVAGTVSVFLVAGLRLMAAGMPPYGKFNADELAASVYDALVLVVCARALGLI